MLEALTDADRETARDRRTRATRLVAGWQAFSIDVETNPADHHRIFKIGAARSDGDASLSLSTARIPVADITRRIDDVAAGARLLVGHNLRRHDRPQLQCQYPGLRCLDMPVLDTLEWSAIAFPANPYHRLVKGYKLLSDSRNDPLRDARITLDLLVDEVEALDAMHAADPDWVALLHFLLGPDTAFEQALLAIRGTLAPWRSQVGDLAQQRFAHVCCMTRLARFADKDSVAPAEHRLALAYALGWIRVAGGNSVLPIWVHQGLPLVRRLVAQLRETDCGSPACGWCAHQHNAEALLDAHFAKPAFRALPAAPGGGSLQRDIVIAGLQRRSLLAVLPTGGGKSICYQLPALVHYARAGQLTVIVSPLQSLMKDQVDNLLLAGVTSAVTVNGMLTPPERRAALDKVRLGDAGIVLVSPEQFRSRSFTEAIRLREIATWVFDEAHCLSKWGQDFRTDYLYVARFIREHFADQGAPVACFTATAKPDVVEDLCLHFRQTLGLELDRFLGGHARANLSYEVLPAQQAHKPQRITEILRHELAAGGAAVVFCARREGAQTMAELLRAQGIRCEGFHAGLAPDLKKSIQQRFIDGELPVIAATNAFGMGVDKADIRVVIHADIPGSLENYLQEAGRAGRDGLAARCVLLFDPQDIEAQFRLSARSCIGPRDFNGLLRALRARSRRLSRDEIVVSARELLAESEGTDIDIESPDATTKVTTAIAWLERSGFLLRGENRSRIFPASLRVLTLEAGLAKIKAADLSERVRERCVTVLTALFRNVQPDGLSTDELMLEAGIPHDETFRLLHQMERMGILNNDLGLVVRLSKGVAGASEGRLQQLDRTERALIDLLAEAAPDADADEQAQPLNVRAVCTELRQRLDMPEGSGALAAPSVVACLKSLAESFGLGTERRRMIDLRARGPETLYVKLHRAWRQIREICGRRRAVAQVVLARLLGSVPPGTRDGNYVVECKAGDLIAAVEADIELRSTLKDPALALEHALLYLHTNGVVELDRGLAVFRSAMTLQLDPEAIRRRFNRDDFAPLQEFYRERTLQTHVMHEYARLGVEQPERAAALVEGYFSLPRRRFVREFFRGRAELLELATTDASYRRIVEDLRHPVQQALVEKPERGNHLVLAGPGSGKTRVIVHRIAWLLKVRRVAPERIIALAFNRSAAVELRRRLLDLAGVDAFGVTVLTYHAMALRLTGTSLAAAARRDEPVDFVRLLQSAIDLLEGRSEAFLDPDEARDRLLAGYEYIFVDEYQDIDERQYALVSALAGRRTADSDARLNIMAVGDDDQNIYSFKGANVEFIRRFQADYGGELSYLVENFRSTQHIIAAANHLIQRGADRMKVDHPIRIDRKRADDPPGGAWQAIDAQTQGRVRSIVAPASPNLQAQVVMQELSRLRQADPELRIGAVAVLARTHRALELVRAACELEGWRHELLSRESGRAQVSFMQLREGARVAALLRGRRRPLVSPGALQRWVRRRCREEPVNPHWQDIGAALHELELAQGEQPVPTMNVLEALHEAAADARRSGHDDALKLLTAHGAKGLEFDHVIVMDCADWRWSGEDERRLLYVAMTRARLTLVLLRAEGGRNPYLTDLGTLTGVAERLPATRPERRHELDRQHLSLGPADVDIGYAGRRLAADRVHADLANLRVGDAVQVVGRNLVADGGQVIGRLAARFVLPAACMGGRVTAVLVRDRMRTAPEYLPGLKVERWEVVLAELRSDPG